MNPVRSICMVLPLATLTMACMAAQAGWLKIEAEPGIRVQVSGVRVETNGPFAEKHVDIKVANTSTRVLEATVVLPLAANERLRGYALDVNGFLRDAVAVDRVQGRVAFEEVRRRGVDPALVEQSEGNNYRLRVFPVPAGSARLLRLDVASLGERRACGWYHDFETGGVSGEQISLSLDHTGGTPTDSQLVWTPARASGHLLAHRTMGAGPTHTRFCVPAPTGVAGFSAAQAGHHFLFADLPAPAGARQPRVLPETVEIVWDSSLSMRERQFEREAQLLTDYFRGRNTNVVLTVMRDQLAKPRNLPIRNGDVTALLAVLRAEPADGASNLAAWTADPAAREVLMFSDLTGTWPGSALVLPEVPVHVIGVSATLSPAGAAFYTRSGGEIVLLDKTTPAAARQQLLSSRARLVTHDQDVAAGWQMASAAPLAGALRACRVSDDASDATLSVRQGNGLLTSVSLPRRSAKPAAAAAFWCASWQAEAMGMDPDRYRTRLSRLGRDFSLVTAESSLVVLEAVSDYVRHRILPPVSEPALRSQVQAALDSSRVVRETADAQARARQMAHLRDAWRERREWWNKDFPKDKPQLSVIAKKETGSARDERHPLPVAAMADGAARREARLVTAEPMAMPAPAPLPTVTRPAANSAEAPQIGMALNALRPDEPYTARLMEARKADTVYQSYLDLRTEYLQSPAFYLDVAERLYDMGDATRARRVMSNIVELLPREQAALRIVAYRLQQAGELANAIPLLERVRMLAPHEPQSFRDLALAYGSAGQCQESADMFTQVITRPWDGRFADIDLIALAELNDQLTRCSPRPRLSGLDTDLLDPLPVGLRAVLTWDLNDTDIDLWVIDPNGEASYFGHRATFQGGRQSRDFTGGYGPEEFVLRNPKPGRYRVEVNYYGSTVARLTRGAIVRVQLQTGFGTPGVQLQTLTLRLAEKSGRIAVGTFEVSRSGGLNVATEDSKPAEQP